MTLLHSITKTALALATATLLVAACHKHDDESDTTNPVITIKSPVESAVVQGNVTIEVSLTDNGLHEMSMKVTKDLDGSEVYKDSPTVYDETDITLVRMFSLTGLSTITPMTLTITAEDHAGNKSTKSVNFVAQN